MENNKEPKSDKFIVDRKEVFRTKTWSERNNDTQDSLRPRLALTSGEIKVSPNIWNK